MTPRISLKGPELPVANGAPHLVMQHGRRRATIGAVHQIAHHIRSVAFVVAQLPPELDTVLQIPPRVGRIRVIAELGMPHKPECHDATTTLPMWKRAQAGLGYLPQQPSIFRGLSVENNIMAILETTNLNLDQRVNRLEELLAEFSY